MDKQKYIRKPMCVEFCVSEIFSNIKVEKVVKEPKKPVQKNRVMFFEMPNSLIDKPIKRHKKKVPVILTMTVPMG